jgi:predicted metal-dependent hydrolase
MQRHIELGDRTIPYSLKKNILSKGIKLRVGEKGLTVTTIKRVSVKEAEHFIKQNKEWVLEQMDRYYDPTYEDRKKSSRSDYLKHKKSAHRLAENKLKQFNEHYNYKYGKITIRDQSTRWGSCSAKGTLSFNYKILHLPPELLDYIIVHELCHLKEMNHSQKFWDLVAQIIPDHKIRRRKLKSLKF